MELSDKIRELGEKLKLLEFHIVAKQEKGSNFSDLTDNQTVNLLTGISSKPAFHKLFDSVKGSIKKVRYWSGPKKTSRKEKTLCNHQKKLDQNGLFLKRMNFF